jgi:hypothetical protein
MYEPGRLTTLWASTALYRDSSASALVDIFADLVPRIPDAVQSRSFSIDFD